MTQKSDNWNGGLPTRSHHLNPESAPFCEYLSEMVTSAFVQEAEVVNY